MTAVAVTSTLVELLNAPRRTLLKVAQQAGIPISRDTRKWDIARALAEKFGDEIPEEAAEYLYAGQRSISWIRLIPESEEFAIGDPEYTYPMRGMKISKEEVESALASEFNREDPYDIEERPEIILEGQPQLIVARPHEDGVLFLFAIAMRKGQAIHNFKAVSVVEDDFFPVIFRPELGLFEVRASADQARRLRRTWLRQFAAGLGAQSVPVSIPYSDLRLLHAELDAKLDVYTGAETDGTSIYETHRYTRDDETCDDLLEETRFQEDTENLMPVNGDLLFKFSEELDEVRVHVSCNNGSIWIRTAVPEGVIRYVRAAMEKVKGV
jgi:hypothetical protein